MKVLFSALGLLLTVLLLVGPQRAQTLPVIERELIGRLDNISKFGTYGGNFDDKVYAENKAFKTALLTYGRRSDVMRYLFPKLKEKMQITTSRDGKLRIYSWDQETGGTMHDHDSVFQYRGTSGKVLTWADNDDEESGGGYLSARHGRRGRVLGGLDLHRFDFVCGPVDTSFQDQRR
jgi:hypothetical protein